MPDKAILEPTRIVGYSETLIGPSESFIWLFECMVGPSECMILIGPFLLTSILLPSESLIGPPKILVVPPLGA